ERAPLTLEAFRVPAAHPELRFFEMHGFHACVERALHTHGQEFPEVRAGAHVIDIAAVTDLLAGAVGLRFILVIDTVEAAVEVILVIPPRNAGHQVNAITAVAPRLDALRQPGINSVNDGDVGTQIAGLAPRR